MTPRTTLRTFHVTVEAFGHIACISVDAATRKEAEETVLQRCGFKVSSKEASSGIPEPTKGEHDEP